MAKIKVISKCELFDGMSITFRAPCDCTAVDGLNVYYNEYSQSFSFRDAQGSDLAGLDGLFAEGTYIKAILDTGHGYAYLQNADTNSYIENDFKNLFYLKDETLTDATKTMYGLGVSATPNTIFQKLAMPYGYYGFDITVVTEDGIPVPNVVLNGVEDFEGNTPVTDENGRYGLAVSESATPTLTISNHIGITNGNHALTADDTYVFTPHTIVVAKDSATKEIISSGTFGIFTPEGSLVDFCAVGGGGGAGCGGEGGPGGGGGGGYISNSLNVTLDSSPLNIIVGGGGSAIYNGTGTAGSGGASSVTVISDSSVLISAAGGGGGQCRYGNYGTELGGGGAGNGNGASERYGTSAGAAKGYLFDDASLGIPGGGGGGSGGGREGASPYGGTSSSVGGRGPGGGGWSSSAWTGSGYKVGGGYRGVIFVRVRFSS